jgi:hypothetical protein
VGPPTSPLISSEFFSLLSFHPNFSLSSSHFLSALCALSASLGFLLKHETGWLGLAGVVVVDSVAWARGSPPDRLGVWVFALVGLRWVWVFALVGLRWVWVFAKAHHQIGLGFGSLCWVWVFTEAHHQIGLGLGLCTGGFALGLGLCRGSPPDQPGVWVFALVGC